MLLALLNLDFGASAGEGSGITSVISGSSVLFRNGDVYVVSAEGLTRWVDYIPVRQVVPTSLNTFDVGGAVGVYSLASNSGLTAWVDYVPVVEVSDSDNRWRYESDGWIPVVFLE